MIEERKYNKGLENMIVLTMRGCGKNVQYHKLVRSYYKKCTRDLSRKDLNTLRREFREGFIMQAAQLMKSMSTNTTVLDMLTNGRPLENKEYTWNILKQQR